MFHIHIYRLLQTKKEGVFSRLRTGPALPETVPDVLFTQTVRPCWDICSIYLPKRYCTLKHGILKNLFSCCGSFCLFLDEQKACQGEEDQYDTADYGYRIGACQIKQEADQSKTDCRGKAGNQSDDGICFGIPGVTVQCSGDH